uniref:Uncharacterized protein n=1 Tax=Marseillevirus LCMAC101 TaxID=2506602 RepID=A0A481YR46_9VIRU|nr:MAG: hypothetical protein LCMAC101_02760 [Marseillevirus LCMAC101]
MEVQELLNDRGNRQGYVVTIPNLAKVESLFLDCSPTMLHNVGWKLRLDYDRPKTPDCVLVGDQPHIPNGDLICTLAAVSPAAIFRRGAFIHIYTETSDGIHSLVPLHAAQFMRENPIVTLRLDIFTMLESLRKDGSLLMAISIFMTDTSVGDVWNDDLVFDGEININGG